MNAGIITTNPASTTAHGSARVAKYHQETRHYRVYLSRVHPGGTMTDQYNTIQETVVAIQYSGDNKQAIINFAGSKVWISEDQESIMVKTPHGSIYVLVDDWVVQKPDGTFHIMRDDEFHEIYKPLDQAETETTELTRDEVKRVLHDIRAMQEEMNLTTVHLIELEKLFMLMVAYFENGMEDSIGETEKR